MVMDIIFKYRNSLTRTQALTTIPSSNNYTSLGKVSGKSARLCERSYVTECTLVSVYSVRDMDDT